MITRHSYRDIVWIDLESPTGEEIRKVVEEFKIHPLLGRELSLPSFRPKVDLYHNVIYLILHFPELGKSAAGREIDFIIGKQFVITSHFGNFEQLHEFSKMFEVNAILDKDGLGEHGGFIFYHMIVKMYELLIRELVSTNSRIQNIEEKIFKGEEKKMVTELSIIGRTLIDFKRETSLHREILDSFELASIKLFGETYRYYARAIVGEYCKVESAIRNSTESFKEIRETNNALLSAKQNEIMKLFTILAFVTFPLSLAINILNIPSESNPLIGHPNAFWIILFGTVITCIGMFSFFKYKKWL